MIVPNNNKRKDPRLIELFLSADLAEKIGSKKFGGLNKYIMSQ
jgi:hypothetical protein